MRASDGNFYATTDTEVLRITPEGGLKILATLDHYTQGDGINCRLVEGLDGSLYGTAYFGGTSNDGTLFKVSLSGQVTVLVTFNGQNGSIPRNDLARGNDGNLYGTTAGGLNGPLLYKLTPEGVFSSLWSGSRLNNIQLAFGDSSDIYGLRPDGPLSAYGEIYKVSQAGVYTSLAGFDSPELHDPQNLVRGLDGCFYGISSLAGGYSPGVFFKYCPEGQLIKIAEIGLVSHQLIASRDGGFIATLPGNSDGSFASIFKITTTGTVTKLVTLDGTSGRQLKDVTESPDGTLFGVTHNSATSKFGTVFKVSPTGVVQTLLSFSSQEQGRNPSGELLKALKGDLYGITPVGGDEKAGTIFKIRTNGIYSRVFSFDSQTGTPSGGLALGSNSNFYGIATDPGAGFYKVDANDLFTGINFHMLPSNGIMKGSDGSFYSTTPGNGPNGSIQKISETGVVVNIDFGGTNGVNPQGKLVEAEDGSFYGTTYQGGDSNYGTIFKLNAGAQIVAVASFDSTTGKYPRAGMAKSLDGSFYGTTSQGGDFDLGTVFKFIPDGKPVTVASFAGANGSLPKAPLFQADDGLFYGTTSSGGAGGYGSLFRLTREGNIQTLVHFNNANGGTPASGLVQADDGKLYGTTPSGGFFDSGTIFRIGTNPLLIAFRQADKMILSWSTNATGMKLQFTTNVSALNGWSDSLSTPFAVDDMFITTNIISSGNQFYRLKK